jgi:hypothetical protein
MSLRSQAQSLTDSRTTSGSFSTARVLIVPVTILLALYMITFSRWGSYVALPRLPVYVGDIGLALALAQVAYLVRRRPGVLTTLGQAPIVLHLTLALVLVAVVRFLLNPSISLDALRDLAPYMYAVVSLLAFLVPVQNERAWRVPIYTLLAIHTAWTTLVPRIPGYPWQLPVLGTDAQVLVARPDIDACVLGATAALVVADLLATRRRKRSSVGLVAFAILNLFGVTALATRAGLLATLAMLAAVAIAAAKIRSSNDDRRRWRPKSNRRQALGILLGLVVLGAMVLWTPTGSRLVETFGSASSQANGTIEVRKVVWDRVGDYVFRSPERTAVGVGFGRNFIDESGSRGALEGDTYVNVRSPHNYVVGTLARLGVVGAGLVACIIGLGLWLAVRSLRTGRGPVTTLAALLCVGLPVTALLGVVLESPFGAMPYFWALGHLCSQTRQNETQTKEGRVLDA